MSVYDIADLRERFDLVLFIGVFYHLRHPLLALDMIHEHVADDLLLFQSLQRGAAEEGQVGANHAFSEESIFDRPDFPKLQFIEHCYCGDPTNWFIPNGAAAAVILRSAGFALKARPEPEGFLCRRRRRPAIVQPPPL